MNLWTFGQLIHALKSYNHITIHLIKPGDFKNYKTLLDMFYHKIDSGKCLPGHIFTADRDDATIQDNKTTMVIKEDDLGTFTPHNVKKDHRK